VTVAEVKSATEEIRRLAGERDHSAAHTAEDKLFRRVLKAVAHGHPESREFAAQALRSMDIAFHRWFD
jgi:hypothetical protein